MEFEREAAPSSKDALAEDLLPDDALDEQVAIHVMGWTTAQIPWAYTAAACCWLNSDNTPLMACHAWRPSRDESQCAQVLETLRARGYSCTIDLSPTTVTTRFFGGTTALSSCTHPDRRIALLRAALQAASS
ncbi:MAG: hypothetical protein GKR94_06545 [Gammaproteobacteria bacterium]|nr:hypothetical protein [Gammaproteobacteria bacterium]